MNDDFINEDFLTVDQKTFQKIIESQTKEIGQWWQFLKELRADYKLAKQVCASQPKASFLRRIQIRNFCALVEAQIHVWKLLTLKFHRMLRAELSDGEISILNEKAYELDDKGNLQARSLHLPMAKNFTFASKIYAKVFCCSKQIDFSKEGWVYVKEVFKVRDRLMHPKFARGIEVEDNEIACLGLAEKWFNNETRALFESQEDFEVITKKKKPSDGLN
jgi:hypothetical protein